MTSTSTSAARARARSTRPTATRCAAEFYRFVDNLRATGFSDLQIVTLLVETTAVFAELIVTRTRPC